MGELYITPGSITRISADVIVYSTDRILAGNGLMHDAFIRDIPEFPELFSSLKKTLNGKLQNSCDVFWLQLERSRPCGIVITIPTGRELDIRKRSYDAVTNTLKCARENINLNVLSDIPQLIAMPTLLTGRGGSWHDLYKVALPQIEAAYEFINENDIDVVFVTYTDATYKAWTAARREVIQTNQNAFNEKESGSHLVESLKSGECALFLGSGMSLNSGLPGWDKILSDLSDELSIPKENQRNDLDYFLDLAQWYREAKKEPTIETRIKKYFSVESSHASPTIAHYLIGSLPARFFITTNYDNLIEYALETLRKYPIRVVTDQDAARTGGLDGTYVIKIHGCATDDGGVVLSRDDYEDFITSRPAMALLLESLLLNQTFLFLGYGLRDPDFRSINHRIANILKGAKKPAFAITYDNITEYQIKQWSNKHIELIGISGKTNRQKNRALYRFLDQLLEKIFENDVNYLTNQENNPLHPTCVDLWNNLAESAKLLLASNENIMTASRSEILAYASTVNHFASLGWRGKGPGHLSRIFEDLSDCSQLSSKEKVNLLIYSMKYCEDYNKAENLKKKIDQIQK